MKRTEILIKALKYTGLELQEVESLTPSPINDETIIRLEKEYEELEQLLRVTTKQEQFNQ